MKMTERYLPVPVRVPTVPPVADMSSMVKSVDDSDRSILSVKVSPILSEPEVGVITGAGALVSMVMETGVFKARLGFPKGSVYLPDVMETVPVPS